jgi:hypothetical protein
MNNALSGADVPKPSSAAFIGHIFRRGLRFLRRKSRLTQ